MRIFCTGISSGIGRDIANDLASTAEVVGVGRKPQPEGLVASVEYTQIDLTHTATFSEYLENVISDCKFDHLILNAGITGRYIHSRELNLNDLDTVLKANVSANFLLLTQIEKILNPGGSVVVISSNTLSLGGSAFNIPYAMSKSALETLSLIIAREYCIPPWSMRVNIIRPGVIDTGLHNKTGGYSQFHFDERIKKIPAGRVGSTYDILNAVRFFINESSCFVTGQILRVSGGE